MGWLGGKAGWVTFTCSGVVFSNHVVGCSRVDGSERGHVQLPVPAWRHFQLLAARHPLRYPPKDMRHDPSAKPFVTC